MVSSFRSMLYNNCKEKFGISPYPNIAEHYLGTCKASYLLHEVSKTVVLYICFLFNRSFCCCCIAQISTIGQDNT